MKVKQPAREVDVCDRCHREGFLQECHVCGAQFCLTCRGIMAGCWVSPDVCRDCSKRPDVQDVVERHTAQIAPIIKARTGELQALPAELPKEGESDDA